MTLALAVAIAMQATTPNSWEMGGGRSWLNPPGGAYCRAYKWSCLDPTIRESRGPKKTIRQEVARIEAKARRGDVRAMRMIGLAKINGKATPKDERAGLGWIYEAAIRGDAVSMFILGRAFEEGIGVAPDPQLAAYWLDRAAKHGLPTGERQ